MKREERATTEKRITQTVGGVRFSLMLRGMGERNLVRLRNSVNSDRRNSRKSSARRAVRRRRR